VPSKADPGRVYFSILGIASVLLCAAVWRFITAGNPLRGILLGLVTGEAITLAMLAVFLPLLRVDLSVRFRFASNGVSVREVREALVVKALKEIPLLAKLAHLIEGRIEPDVIRGGMQFDVHSFVTEYTVYAFVLAAVLIPVALILSVLVSPTLLALFLVPVIVLLTPSLRAKNSVSERRVNIRDELPFFTLLASIMQSSGLSLYNAFLSVLGRHMLPATEMEARIVRKGVGFGNNAVDSLDALAAVHPDDTFKHFLYGYTSILRSGGDLVLYLNGREKEFLGAMRFRWQKYSETMGTIGEGLISVFVLLPLLLVVGSVTMPPELVAALSYAGVAALPMIALVAYFVVKMVQPKTYDRLSGDARLGIIGLCAGLILTLPTREPWLIIGISGAAGAALYGLPVRSQLREIRMIEGALPNFLREVSEYRKIGYDIRKAVLKISEESRFNQVFDSVLGRVAAQMRMGARLGEVQVPMRSWLGRVTFFILDQVMENGGGTPVNIEDLYGFISSYNELRREAASSINLYRFLGYAVPVAIPFVVTVLLGIVGSFGSATSVLLGGSVTSIAIVNEAAAIITVVAAGSMAFTMTRATDFTAKNTVIMAILLSLAVVSISLTQYLPSISLGF
jgi:archaeal flagellar protein FlaJ